MSKTIFSIFIKAPLAKLLFFDNNDLEAVYSLVKVLAEGHES
jgi:hypothetical protein